MFRRPQPIAPQAGQESVWDYPRPPRLEPTARHIRIVFNGVTVADTRRALRLLETSHPPTYYLPPADLQMQYLTATPTHVILRMEGASALLHAARGG